MKRPVYVIIFALVSLVVIGLFSQTNNAVASTYSYDVCQNAQNFIQQTVRRNDLSSRVDHLQLYEFTYDNLNTVAIRLKDNNQPGASILQKTVSQYRVAIDSFKSDYETYDLSRDQLTGLKDCANNKSQFNTLLSKARKNRQAVDKDVLKLNNLLDVEVSSKLDDLLNRMQSQKAGV